MPAGGHMANMPTSDSQGHLRQNTKYPKNRIPNSVIEWIRQVGRAPIGGR